MSYSATPGLKPSKKPSIWRNQEVVRIQLHIISNYIVKDHQYLDEDGADIEKILAVQAMVQKVEKEEDYTNILMVYFMYYKFTTLLICVYDVGVFKAAIYSTSRMDSSCKVTA